MELNKPNGEVRHVAEMPGQIHEFRPAETKGPNDDCIYAEVQPAQSDPRDEALKSKDAQLVRNDSQIQLMRDELAQYRQDLTMWMKAHGSEYPARRLHELEKKMLEIDQA